MHENEKREQYLAEVQRCTKTGKWGTNRLQEEQESIRRKEFVDNKLAHLQARIRIQAAAYRANVIKFIEMLLNHTDPSLRLLAEHMNFNGHYCTSTPGSSSATGSVTSGYPIPVALEGLVGVGGGGGGYQQKLKSLTSSISPSSSQQQQHQQEVGNADKRHNNIIILRSAVPYSGSVTPTSSLTVASRQPESSSCISQASDITSSRKNSSGSSDDYKGGGGGGIVVIE
ncbi:unnamed protein product [Trichobilharzia szidati]|nr:unnamed protein product [Trichobilharzia szidati]